MVGFGGAGGGLGPSMSRLFQGLKWTHRAVMWKQRLTTLKLFGIKIIKLQKPVLGGLALFVASLGYQEWVKARHALKITSNEKEMSKLFDQLDDDHNGSLDRQELTTALQKAGIDVNQLQVELMMRSADENADDQISKEEWLTICKKLSGTDHKDGLKVTSSSNPNSSSSGEYVMPHLIVKSPAATKAVSSTIDTEQTLTETIAAESFDTASQDTHLRVQTHKNQLEETELSPM